jgi:hypothetical protein
VNQAPNGQTQHPQGKPRKNSLMELEPLDATISLAYAFDIGYEIDLKQAGPLVAGAAGALPRRRRTPESIRYRPEPLRSSLDASALAVPAAMRLTAAPRAELTLFDFGVVSLMVHCPVRATPDELLRLAGELADPVPLTASARALVAPSLERVRPAVTEFDLSDLFEEYVVFQLHNLRTDWLQKDAAWVAGLVRLEPESLSEHEIGEATRLHLSYTPNDLVVLDWAAGFVADRDCADTLQVIEYANVQLLEFRHIDDRLDDRLEAAYRLIRPARKARWPLAAKRSHSHAVRSVRELEIEATSLFERADNALKLIGDQYLSRVFDLASTRFHLGEWQQSIHRKLETVGDVYDLLVHQASSARMELLEVIVVVLIALEIVLVLFGHR